MILQHLISTSLLASQGFPKSCPKYQPPGPNDTIGVCPQDYTIVGPELEPVHESKNAPTGLAVDTSKNLYLAYPRNGGPSPLNVVICTDFYGEVAWPSEEIQNCVAGQNASTCFVNVQNVVLDSIGQMWAVDSGIPPGATEPVPFGAKIMSFNISTKSLIRTYPIPESLTYGGLNLNDMRVNNTLGIGGFAFMTEISPGSSLLAVNLDTGEAARRLYNTSVVKADEKYVGSFDGQLIYLWNGTNKSYFNIGADGIALQSGQLFWGVLASRRFYYIPQSQLANFSASEEEILASVVFPGQLGSEQAGFTADDKGRVYIMASEPNAIYYVDTLQAYVTEEVNGVPPGGIGMVPQDNYVVKTLVKNALIQHADSAAILDGYLYFNTNQLALGPGRQYGNADNRRGPFRSYRIFIGAGPAV